MSSTGEGIAANKALVRRYVDEVENGHDLQAGALAARDRL